MSSDTDAMLAAALEILPAALEEAAVTWYVERSPRAAAGVRGTGAPADEGATDDSENAAPTVCDLRVA